MALFNIVYKMRIQKNKKGEVPEQDIWVFLVNLLLFVMVFSTLLFSVTKVQDRALHNERVLSRDVSFLHNVLSHAPKGSEIAANFKMKEGFDLELSKEPCLTKINKRGEDTIIQYPCADNKIQDYKEEIINKEGLVLSSYTFTK